MMDSHKYNTRVEWKHDRLGVLSAEGVDDRFDVVTPPEFPNGIAGKWSPEHLFAASIGSCLMTTFAAIAENSRLEFHEFGCDASCTLEQVEGRYVITGVDLHPSVTIAEEKYRDKTMRLLEKSKKICLISNALSIPVNLQNADIRVEEAVAAN